MAKKDPKNQNNTLTFTTGTKSSDGVTKPCIKTSPHILQFCKRINREIILAAPPTNTGPVVLTFTKADADEIFEKHSASPLTLNPGSTEKWVIKSNIANLSAPDGDFANPRTTPGFASIGRLFKFEFERCDEEDHNDFHVEC